MSHTDDDTTDVRAVAAAVTREIVEAVSTAEERGLTPAESVCVVIGVLKAMIRDLGPDAERVARFAAMECGLLAEGRSASPQALH